MTIQRLETDDNPNPTLDTLTRLARAFELPLSRFIEIITDEDPDRRSVTVEIVQGLQDLTGEQRAMVAERVRVLRELNEK